MLAGDIVSIHTLVLDVSVSTMDYAHTNVSTAVYSIPTTVGILYTGCVKDSRQSSLNQQKHTAISI